MNRLARIAGKKTDGIPVSGVRRGRFGGIAKYRKHSAADASVSAEDRSMPATPEETQIPRELRTS